MRKQAQNDAARATHNEVRHLASALFLCPRYAKEAVSFFSCSMYP